MLHDAMTRASLRKNFPTLTLQTFLLLLPLVTYYFFFIILFLASTLVSSVLFTFLFASQLALLCLVPGVRGPIKESLIPHSRKKVSSAVFDPKEVGLDRESRGKTHFFSMRAVKRASSPPQGSMPDAGKKLRSRGSQGSAAMTCSAGDRRAHIIELERSSSGDRSQIDRIEAAGRVDRASSMLEVRTGVRRDRRRDPQDRGRS